MQKDEVFYRNVIEITSVVSALILAVAQLLFLDMYSHVSLTLSLFIINAFHLSFALLFTLELILMKLLGRSLFGNKNRKKQNSMINRMTFIAFSVLFFNLQTCMFEQNESYIQILTEAFFFSMFLSGGMVYIMLWGMNAFFQKKKDIEPQKETVKQYGICYIDEFETDTRQLSNTLYALSQMEEELSQEAIIHINEKTKELQSLFALFKKMSPSAKREVEQDILFTIETLNQKLEHILFSEDEKYIRLIKRKTKRINAKTV